MKSCIIFLLCCICPRIYSDIELQSCDSNKCYQTINIVHDNVLELINSLNSTSSSANITKLYDLEPLNDQVKTIGNQLTVLLSRFKNSTNKLKECRTNVNNHEKIVGDLLKKVHVEVDEKTITELNQIINLIDEYVNKHERGGNTSNECHELNDKFISLEQMINNLRKSYDEVQKTYENVSARAETINKNVNDTFEETIRNQKKIETELNFPVDLLENYAGQTEAKLIQSVRYLKDNAELLKELLKAAHQKADEEIAQKIKETKLLMSQVQDDLNSMNEGLTEYESVFITHTFKSIINSELLQDAKLLEDTVEELQERLGEFDLDDVESLIERAKQIGRKTALLREYEKILDAIPATDEQLERIEDEIANVKLVISLTSELERVRRKLVKLKDFRDALPQKKEECPQKGKGALT